MHNFPPENLRNPARNRRAGLMRQFRPGQLDSMYNIQDFDRFLFRCFSIDSTKVHVHR
jgi:hypothetical protein